MNAHALRFGLALLALAAFALLVATPAAALHRCTGADGKITYTDEQCDTGAKASGVAIHDSSGMNPNKRTNSFKHTAPTLPKSSSSPAPTANPMRGLNTRKSDVRADGRPPTMRWVPAKDKEVEQKKLNREWEEYLNPNIKREGKGPADSR